MPNSRPNLAPRRAKALLALLLGLATIWMLCPPALLEPTWIPGVLLLPMETAACAQHHRLRGRARSNLPEAVAAVSPWRARASHVAWTVALAGVPAIDAERELVERCHLVAP